MKRIEFKLITKYLLQQTGKEENEMIQKIINEDDMSRKDFEAYIDIWEKSTYMKGYDAIDVESDWHKVRSKMRFRQKTGKISPYRYFVRIAAILILAFGLVFFLNTILKKVSKSGTEYYELAATVEKRQVNLPDGSIIVLNRNSKVVRNNDYGVSNRDIILEGEAYFEVVRNTKLPFKVYSQNSTVEVLGTRFNIKTNNDNVVVGVFSGKVSFYQTGNKENGVELIHDNTGIYRTKENNFVLKPIVDANIIAWNTGRLVFKKTPVADVFETVANHFDKQLFIEPGTPVNNTFNGNFDKQSLDEIIEIINMTLPDKLNIIATEDMLIVKKH